MNMRYVATVLAAILALFGCWVAGFDFDQRGAYAFTTYLVTMASAILTYTCPVWEDWK